LGIAFKTMEMNTFTPSQLKFRALGFLLLSASLACNSGSATISVPIAISISPKTATTTTGNTVNFTAAVMTQSGNETIMRVNWSVQERDGGSVDSSGRYTAPRAPGMYHVVATTLADSSKFDVAVVTVSGTQVSVRISPGTVSVRPRANIAFASTVSGIAPPQSDAVTYSVRESGGGTIDS
jgi:ethanolamine utilization protein EutP (predicted NTPase)